MMVLGIAMMVTLDTRLILLDYIYIYILLIINLYVWW